MNQSHQQIELDFDTEYQEPLFTPDTDPELIKHTDRALRPLLTTEETNYD